ncbi:EAL domain-containing protein [Pseudomonas lundensis]|uniref:EAL domain-containing protein n=1 Tax=Serratia proteamaculans TaxID=28151 RepID=UPI0029821B26|nr:EAL domain-containing protein [Serratia proteamaculans]MDW5502535.1 EAL domain-containing protein [Serratia proteamaculans]MDW5507591.1 EAL domain-containing protein [Pseudomonas lundensis]
MVKPLFWKHLRERWWGYPLILSLLLIPFAGWLSPRIMLPEGKVYLLYLPLTACIALLMVYDWRALPGITLAILFRYSHRLGLESGMLVTLLYLFCLSLCWLGYRYQTQRRWCAAPGVPTLVKARLIWLVVLPALLFVFGLKLLVGLTQLPDELGMMSGDSSHLLALVNFQALLLGCLSAMPLFYFVFRILNKPIFLLTLWRRFGREMAPNTDKKELSLWLLVLGGMVALLSYQANSVNPLLLGGYGLILLLPVMLYGAMRFGYQLICIIWSSTLLVLFFHYPVYAQRDNLLQNLAVISSMMVVFTLCIFLMSALNTRQRLSHARAQSASLQDPVIGLPNLRALKRDLAQSPPSTLCFLRVSELDLLSRNYGMQLRIRFKQQLAALLRQVLAPGEGVYHLPGYDLLLRIDGEDSEEKVAEIYHALEKFRLVWNGLPLHPPLGLGYCSVVADFEHLYLLLGELSSLAEVSLTSGKPESVQNGGHLVQGEIKRKVALLHGVQHSLDNDGFILMAQPIVGLRGDRYHEILLRMRDAQGDIVSPNDFLPVVHEFGLAYRVDIWVLRNTLKFMDRHRSELPSARFAVNLSPSSLCRPMLCHDISSLLELYRIEPYQLTLEVTESHLLQNTEYAGANLQALREMGCRIALDDFGTGYASYDRLKMLPVDMLKIDGSFVRDMLTNPVDFQVIASICKVARMKRLSIVAEYVESVEQLAALKGVGVDYMQGYFIGEPQPLAALLPRQD